MDSAALLTENECKDLSLTSNNNKLFNIVRNKCLYLDAKTNTSGLVIKDILSFDNYITVTNFVCTNNKDLIKSTEGILSLTSLFNNLYYFDKNSYQPVYSLYLTKEGGYISIGYDYTTNSSYKYKTTKFYQNNKIELSELSIRSKEKIYDLIQNKDNQILLSINSLNNLTYIPKYSLNILVMYLVDVINNLIELNSNDFISTNFNNKTFENYEFYNNEICLIEFNNINYNNIQQIVNSSFSDLIFKISQDITYIWKPSNYFYYKKSNKENNTYLCLGISVSDNNNEVKLGNNWMIDNHILFNIQKNEISFLYSNNISNNFYLHSNYLNSYNIELNTDMYKYYYSASNNMLNNYNQLENENLYLLKFKNIEYETLKQYYSILNKNNSNYNSNFTLTNNFTKNCTNNMSFINKDNYNNYLIVLIIFLISLYIFTLSALMFFRCRRGLDCCCIKGGKSKGLVYQSARIVK